MSYLIEHTRFGFCWWDIPALIVLLIVIVVFVVKRHGQKKEEKELEDQLSSRYADDTMETAEEA